MIVLKIGGSEGINYDYIADDVAALVKEGQPLIVIHGGSALTNQVAAQLGHPPQFVTSVSGFSSRRTDRRTLEIFEMVYCGQVNKGLVEKLQQRGVNAVGLSGIDGRIWEGPRKDAIKIIDKGRKRVIRDDYTGKVEKVNTALVSLREKVDERSKAISEIDKLLLEISRELSSPEYKKKLEKARGDLAALQDQFKCTESKTEKPVKPVKSEGDSPEGDDQVEKEEAAHESRN